MRNHSKTFFSKARAEKFASQLNDNKAKDIIIVIEKDYLNNGSLYFVKWN